MSNALNRGRQEILVLEQEFDFQDLAASPSGLKPNLPVGAIVLRGAVHVETVFNGTTPTISVGKAGATTQYLNAGSLASVALVALTAGFGIKASGEQILLTPNAGATASTAGKARLVMEYIIDGRACEVQP